MVLKQWVDSSASQAAQHAVVGTHVRQNFNIDDVCTFFHTIKTQNPVRASVKFAISQKAAGNLERRFGPAAIDCFAARKDVQLL